jgi:hypothetical protein
MKRMTPVMLPLALRVGLQAAAMRRAARPVDLRVAPAVRLRARVVRLRARVARPAVVISTVDRVRRVATVRIVRSVATVRIVRSVATEKIAPRAATAMTGRRARR